MHETTGLTGADQARADGDAGVGWGLPWPPPGLELIHGAFQRATLVLLAGSALTVLPLLMLVAREQAFWADPGLGYGWFVLAVAVLIGGVLLIGGIDILARALFTAGRAGRAGYDGALVLHVLADAARDSGLLLQARRHYARLEAAERTALLALRSSATLAWLGAALWLPAGFGFGLLLASLGVLGSGTGLLLLTLVPAALLALGGAGTQMVDAAVTRRARRRWQRDVVTADVLTAEAAAWRDALEARTGAAPGAPARRSLLRGAGWAAIGIGVLLPLPLISMLAVSGAGSVKAALGDVNAGSSSARLTRLESLRPYALPADPAITPEAAGQALHALAFTGRDPDLRDVAFQRPARVYPVPWAAEGVPPAPLPPLDRLAGSGTIARAWAGQLGREEVAFLEQAAAHPAHGEFAIVARAAAADLAGTRWTTAALVSTPSWLLPVGHIGPLRSGAHTHIALATLYAARRDERGAETALRAVISTGLLLGREAVGQLDVFVGATMVDHASTALAELYEATGRIAEAGALANTRAALEATSRLTRTLERRAGRGGSLRGLMDVAADSTLPRGVRWEALHTVSLGVACHNPHVAVFGTGAEHAAWLATARAGLVRSPAEAHLFDAMTAPISVPAEYQRRSGVMRRLAGLTLRPASAAECGALLTALLTSF
jgi:hypothetical protein